MGFETNEDVGKMSMFNGGLLQVKRIGDLQERINLVSLNPLSFNENFGVHNYEIWITSIDSLLQEITPKLSDKEKLAGEKVKNFIHKFITTNKIFKTKKSLSRRSSSMFVDIELWSVMYIAINHYEKLIRKYLDDHKMNSPEEQEMGMF